MMTLDKLCFLLRGLREMVAADPDAGVAIADLALRIAERHEAKSKGEKKLPSVSGFCVECHRREMEELDKKIAASEAKQRRRGRAIRRMVRGRR